MDASQPNLRAMSKEMDSDFRERLIKAAKHANVAFTPQSLGTFLGVDRRKAAVWMSGSLPRADKLFEFAGRFGVDPRWFATGKGDMVLGTGTSVAPRTNEPMAGYDTRISAGTENDAQKLLVLVRTFLDTDAEGRMELMSAAEAVAQGHPGSARQNQPRRAKRR